MTSKHRVFSTQHTFTYNDYIKLKSGNEILKSIKYNTSNNIINKFRSYEDYIKLYQSFSQISKYTSKTENICSTIYTTNLYNANISYNLYDEIKECKTPIIYPNAIYKGNKEPNTYFPGPINLDLWCIQNKCLPIELHNQDSCQNINLIINSTNPNNPNNLTNSNNSNNRNNTINPTQDNENNTNISDLRIGNKCKTGLCKNAKALFI